MSQKHSEQYKIIGQAIKKYRKQRKRQIFPRLAKNHL